MASDHTPAQMAMPTGAWPDFAETWFGETWFGDNTTYPTGRGQDRPLRGWVCSGCGHGFGPAVRECTHCPEDKAPEFIAKSPGGPVDVMGDWGDE